MTTKTYQPLDVLIEQTGLKYGFIAKELGISTQRLYDMRINPRSMGVEQMEKLAHILNVSFMDVYEVQKKFRAEVDKNTTNRRIESI